MPHINFIFILLYPNPQENTKINYVNPSVSTLTLSYVSVKKRLSNFLKQLGNVVFSQPYICEGLTNITHTCTSRADWCLLFWQSCWMTRCRFICTHRMIYVILTYGVLNHIVYMLWKDTQYLLLGLIHCWLGSFIGCDDPSQYSVCVYMYI